jgi:hypothetical protein
MSVDSTIEPVFRDSSQSCIHLPNNWSAFCVVFLGQLWFFRPPVASPSSVTCLWFSRALESLSLLVNSTTIRTCNRFYTSLREKRSKLALLRVTDQIRFRRDFRDSDFFFFGFRRRLWFLLQGEPAFTKSFKSRLCMKNLVWMSVPRLVNYSIH